MAISSHAALEKFSSAHSVALDGLVKGKIEVEQYELDNFSTKRNIKNQLMYSIGQLNGIDGGSPDINKLEIKIEQIEESENFNTKIVYYTAKLFVAWPKEQSLKKNLTLFLPKQGNHHFLNNFKEQLGNEKKSANCLGWGAHDVTTGNFWYYYRPKLEKCPIQFESEEYLNKYIYKLNLNLKYSNQNTKDKYPEYHKVWEDGVLKVTAIFAKNEKESSVASDAGVQAFNRTIRSIINTFGHPSQSNLGSDIDLMGYYLGIYHPEIHFIYKLEEGILDIKLFLIGDIKYTDDIFRQKYNKRTKDSDFVSYSGHSGLGANIRTLAKMGEFVSDQYQIFLVNGCDTFAYVDDSLALAHQAVNPMYGPNKFLDIITNAMPSYFHMNHRSNMAIITGLVNQTESYAEILGNFDINQRAVVTGEEDNSWPNEFYK